MSTFDLLTNAPGLLRAESLNVQIRFERTGPTTGRVSWNIPTPASGCTAETQAYCGMLVTLDTTPASIAKSPTAGQIYASDATADPALFAGDKIETAFVVGAFYEDRTTTFFDITGLKANTAYYLTGYPVDCQYRYFVSGVHAYSQDFTGKSTEDTSGVQIVALAGNSSPITDFNVENHLVPVTNIRTAGINSTDVTGLICGAFYDFKCQIHNVAAPNTPRPEGSPGPELQGYTITIDGCYASTYQDLANEINKQFALLSNPPQGPLPPSTNGFYWEASTQKLFQWNGYTHVEVPVIIQGTDPSIVVIGTYWYNPETEVLQIWNGTTWNAVTVINFATDPTVPICDKTYWFNGTQGYLWNGVTWCEHTTYISTTDPSVQLSAPCGSFWYDSDDFLLYRWNDTLGMWDVTSAIQYFEDPNSLTNGAYWLDETSVQLKTWNVPNPGWNVEANVAIQETEPTTPAVGKFWYNPALRELRQWDGMVWQLLEVIIFPTDPTVRESCDLWWDTMLDVIKVWDVVNNEWDTATTFYQQATDPTLPPNFVDGDLWYNPDTDLLGVWQNICFKDTPFINWPTDPTLTIPNGTVWFDGTEWWVKVTTGWDIITPVVTVQDPTMFAPGTYWFNTTNNSLQAWNGVVWMNITYSTTPLTPAKQTLWYDNATGMLMIWDGTTWVAATPLATVEIDPNGNFTFTDTNPGSLSYIAVQDITLFQTLLVPFRILLPQPGTDGLSGEPAYKELGVGTDGSTDERFALMNEIRYELGYPVVDVELTQEQLDFCVSRAIEEIRGRSNIAYRHGFFFMRINAETQKYQLTNKVSGMNKIVNITGIYRLTSAFLSSAHGAGIYGQIVLQHLYNMGTFDLLSYHMIADYVELMEILFAARVTFTWDEHCRELWIHHRFPFNERMVLIECSTERVEQEIIVDRWCRSWIRRYAAATAREILAEIRGKYSSLPGAGGGISLNAAELRAAASEMKLKLEQEVFDYVADKPEDFGLGAQLVIG
jgi:hypothetical protein